MAVNKTLVGFLVLVILSASIYVMLPDKVKIYVENTRTKYYVNENSNWVLGGTEYVHLYDGTTKMRAKSRALYQLITGDEIIIKRTSTWKDNITTIQTYKFDGSLDNVELVPVLNEFECFNCQGKIVHYEFRDIEYSGPTRAAVSPESFGHNMKVEWEPGYDWAKVYQQLVSDKLVIRYRPSTSHESYSVRMFDPTPTGNISLFLDGLSEDRKYEYYTNATLLANYSDGANFTICFDIGDVINHTCLNASELSVNYRVEDSEITEFNDSSTTADISATNGSLYIDLDVNTKVDSAIFNITGTNNQLISFTYTPTHLNMTDGCDEAINITPNSTDTMVVCLQESGTDITGSCKTYSDSTYGIGSEFVTGEFMSANLTDGGSYRFSIRWQRITFNLTGTPQNDSGGSASASPNPYSLCYVTAAHPTATTTCPSGAVTRFSFGANCIGDWSQWLASPFTNADCTGTDISDNDMWIGQSAPSARIYEGYTRTGGTNASVSGCQLGQSMNYSNSCTCSGAANSYTGTGCTNGTFPSSPANLCTYAGDNTAYSDYFTYDEEVNASSTSFSTKLNSTGSIEWNEVDYPTNIEIDADQDGVHDIILLGQLMGNFVFQEYFYYSGTQYTTLNISRSTAGTRTIYLNVSSIFDDDGEVDNFTFKISGYDIDASNSYAYTEEFNSSAWLDFDNSTYYDSPLWTWDDFFTDTRTTLVKSAGSGSIDVDTTDERIECSISSSASGGDTDSDSQKWCTTGLNLSQYKKIEFYFTTSASASCSGCDDCATSACSVSVGITSSASCSTIQGLPGTNSAAGANCYSGRCSDSNSDTESGTYTLERVEDVGSSTYTFKVYEGSTYKGTTSALSGDINYAYTATSGVWTDSGCGASCSLSGVFDTIRLSATSGNYTTNLTYTNNFSIMSKEMYTAPTNIEAAKLTAREYMPTGCSSAYFLSNDNGTTFESITSGYSHAFTSSGDSLKWFANVTGCPTSDTGAIIAVDLEIVPQSVTNIEIDAGIEGVDWNTSLVLNTTNSPQNVTIDGTVISDYVAATCPSATSCEVPIVIEYGTGGTIEFHDFNLTMYPNPITLTTSWIDDFDPIELAFEFINGIITVFALDINFFGTHNITVIAHDGAYGVNDTQIIQVRYSDFNVSLPNGTHWWEVFPASNTESNVTPWSQEDTIPIWNVTGQAQDDAIDIYIRTNESLDTCYNITWDDDNTKSGGIELDTTARLLCDGMDKDGNCGVWNWVDLNNCTSLFELPWFFFSSICDECVVVDDHWLTNIIVE